ncbi:Hpt domain protein [Marinomonas spartinae]|uniref:Hpt domain protein n=1 Tax=Marinomonas spartinae TaxID=1792290 RepID=A0A1A8T3R9_9GAMM|nr:Hpt domain-containing protein [Marinomonas spartinae]SBS26504.1 Hpt domain protein [Marinomonas spartinae]SBS40176.1 Hpt domain protein [Marinomonas spartinae]
MVETVVFDFNDFKNRMASSNELMALVAAEFLREAAYLVSQLDESIQAEDWLQVAQVAHRLKGASAEVSGQAMTESARAIEFAAKEGDFSVIAELYVALNKYYVALRDELSEFLLAK